MLKKIAIGVLVLAALGSKRAAAIGCYPWECGTNGAWLGQGIEFHELDAAGQPNAAGVVVKGFKDNQGPLEIIVDHDVLMGKRADGTVVKGQDLVQAEATLRLQVGKDGPKYKLKITGFATTPYWVEPTSEKVPVYFFRYAPVKSCSPKCDEWLDMCRPPPDSAEWAGVKGMAVIFRGDRYKAGAKTVKQTGGSDTWFNIACAGTTVAKMHLLRHTWAGTDAGHHTEVKDRQAVLKMLSADYCGTGKPFTVNGHPLLYGYTKKWEPQAPSPVNWNDAKSIDAVWNQDGAVCLNVPRLKDQYTNIRQIILNKCSPKVLKACEDGLMSALKSWSPGSPPPWGDAGYALSANPAPTP